RAVSSLGASERKERFLWRGPFRPLCATARATDHADNGEKPALGPRHPHGSPHYIPAPRGRKMSTASRRIGGSRRETTNASGPARGPDAFSFADGGGLPGSIAR